MIDRAIFTARFHEATQRARDFARTLVLDELPDALVFYVYFKAHDSQTESGLSHERAIDKLYRDGSVPLWVDVNVRGVDPQATIIEVCASRELVSEERDLMHSGEGYPPFHVLGPIQPPDWELEQGKFRLT
jgi:hypothetical protein